MPIEPISNFIAGIKAASGTKKRGIVMDIHVLAEGVASECEYEYPPNKKCGEIAVFQIPESDFTNARYSCEKHLFEMLNEFRIITSTLDKIPNGISLVDLRNTS